MWFCTDRNAEIRELSRLEPVSLAVKKSDLIRFGHTECNDDNDWVKSCTTMEADDMIQGVVPGIHGTLEGLCPKDMESLSLSADDGQFRNKWRCNIQQTTR